MSHQIAAKVPAAVAFIAAAGLTVVAVAACRTGSIKPTPPVAGPAPPNAPPASPAGQSEPPIIQPGAPGESSRVIAAEKAVDLSHVQHTPADVRFMQGMIGHHAQALEMTALLSTRTNREEMRMLARRIEISQADEIKMMQHWLEVRGQALPDPHAHHHGGALMPGMLTPEEMSRLAEARGAAFDRLFLELMIKHHEGALVMVKELFATPGAAQETEIFSFASDVDADQRVEIDRMRAMLNEASS